MPAQPLTHPARCDNDAPMHLVQEWIVRMQWCVTDAIGDGAEQWITTPVPGDKMRKNLCVVTGTKAQFCKALDTMADRLVRGDRILWVAPPETGNIADILCDISIPASSRLFALSGDHRTLYRLDPDGAHPVRTDASAPRAPLSRDFATLSAARRVVMRANAKKNDLDHGRAAQSQWIARQTGPVADGVTVTQLDRHRVHIVPPAPTGLCVSYIHGGGLVHYDCADFVPMLSRLAAQSGAAITLHGYDKCPENSAEDCLEPLMQRIAQSIEPGSNTVLMGDSIGGLIALYAARRLCPGTSAMLLYPVLSLDDLFASHVLFGDGLFLDDVTMRWFRQFFADWFKARNFNPLTQQSVDLPQRISIFAATCDVLADEAQAFANLHPRATLDWLEGTPHDALLYDNTTGCAALARVAQHLKHHHTPKGIST